MEITNSYITANYNIIKLLGEGSFGKVYLAEKKNNININNNDKQNYIVIKVIDIRFMTLKQKEDIFNEGKIMKSLHHINIINFIDFIYDNENEYIFILMEYAEKGDLEQKILSLKTQGTYLDEDSILDYFLQICQGIKYMHDKKIIHRDLKLQNIFITKNNKIKIGDFGLAKLLNLSSKAHTFIGTPFYISPEIINGEPYDYKTDIWALGIILYRLCNFSLPFNSDNLAQLSIKIISGKFEPIRENINNEIKKLITKMLNVNKENRPSIDDILKMEFIKKIINNKYNKNNKLKTSNSTKYLNSYINNRYSVHLNGIFSKKSFNEIQKNFKNYCQSDKKPNNKFLNNNKINNEKILNNKNLNQIKIYKCNLNNNKFKQLNNNFIHNNDKTNNKLKLNKKNSAGNIKNKNSLLEEYMTNMNEQIRQSTLISQNILHDLWEKNNSNRYKDEEELLSSYREEDSLGKNLINKFNNNNSNDKLDNNLNNQIKIINDSFKEEEKNLDYLYKDINSQKNNNILNDIDSIKKELDWIDSHNEYFKNNDELYESNIKFNIINKIGNELYNNIYKILSKKLNNNILEYNLSEIKKEIEKYLINKKYSNIDIKNCNKLIYDIYFLIISEKNKNK